MLHVFVGKDTVAVRENMHVSLAKYEEKGADIERIESEHYVPGLLHEIGRAHV